MTDNEIRKARLQGKACLAGAIAGVAGVITCQMLSFGASESGQLWATAGGAVSGLAAAFCLIWAYGMYLLVKDEMNWRARRR